MSKLRACRFCGGEAMIGETEFGSSVAYCRNPECPTGPSMYVDWDPEIGDEARNAMRPILTRMWNAAMAADLSAKSP